MYLVPNQRSVRWLRPRLLGDEPRGAILQPNLCTFSQLARTILQYHGVAVRPISWLAQRLLIREIVTELADASRLASLATIAHTRGLIAVLQRFLADLKRAQILPETFHDVANQRGASPKEQDLAAIYAAYQDRLIASRLYDDEGLFWEARQRVCQGELGPFGAARVLVADGFWDFSPAQRDILKALASHLKQMRISLTLDPDGSRADLFHRCHQTRDLLEKELGATCEVVPRPESFAVPALHHLEEHVLGDSLNRPRCRDTDGVEIIEAVGSLGELEMVAGRVKRLIRQGTPPDEIALVFRALEPYAPLIDEVARRFGIPLERPRGQALDRQGLVSALMAALQLRLRDYEFPILVKVVRSQHFRPTWMSDDTSSVGDRADRVLRALNVASGQANYVRALAGLQRRCQRSAASDEPDDLVPDLREDVPVCARLLDGLFAELDRFPHEGTLVQFVDATRVLVERLGMRTDAQDPLSSADRAALDVPSQTAVLEGLEQALSQLRAAGDVLALGQRVWSLRQFVDLLRDATGSVELATGPAGPGCVQVLSAHEARTLSFPHVFVLGLTDQQFPAPRATGPLYGQAEAERWVRHGLHVPQPRYLIHEEMLLYYASVTRARRRLVLCRSACTPDGRDELASPFLEDTLACFPKHGLGTDRQTLGDVTPPDVDGVWTPGDLRLFAVNEALDGRPATFHALVADASDRTPGPHMRQALLALHARVGHREPGPYDGVLGSSVSAWLTRASDARPCVAVTGLERYAQCPFGYFVSDVLGVEVLPEPSMDLAGIRLGIIVHDILSDFHRTLAESDAALGTDQQADLLRQVSQAVFQRCAGQCSEAEQVLWELEQRRVTALLDRYLEQWRERQASSAVAWRPTFIEVAFGRRARGGADPASVTKPLVVKQGRRAAALSGRVDRIDVARTEHGCVFTVIDYKTGRHAPGRKDMLAGSALQLPVYALATQRLLLEDADALPAALCYWMIGGDGRLHTVAAAELGPDGWVETPDWTAIREQAVASIFAILDAIRQAEFPLCPRRDCPSYCDYRYVCRAGEAEAVGKAAPSAGDAHG